MRMGVLCERLKKASAYGGHRMAPVSTCGRRRQNGIFEERENKDDFPLQ